MALAVVSTMIYNIIIIFVAVLALAVVNRAGIEQYASVVYKRVADVYWVLAGIRNWQDFKTAAGPFYHMATTFILAYLQAAVGQKIARDVTKWLLIKIKDAVVQILA